MKFNKEIHNKICHKIHKIRQKFDIYYMFNHKGYEWLGSPYAYYPYEDKIASLYKCKICGLEILHHRRYDICIDVIWQEWLDKPDFEYWHKKKQEKDK